MSTRFDIVIKMCSLIRVLRYLIDITSVAEIDCLVLRARNTNRWLRLVVNDKVSNFILANLLLEDDSWENMDIDIVNYVLTMSGVQEEVDLDDYLEQRGVVVPAHPTSLNFCQLGGYAPNVYD